MFNVTQRLVQQAPHMGVIQAVDSVAPAPGADHQPQVAQDPQLVRDRRLGHFDTCCQFTHRAGALAQMRQDPNPTARGQCRHHSGNPISVLRANWCAGYDTMILRHAHMLACTCQHVTPQRCSWPRHREYWSDAPRERVLLELDFDTATEIELIAAFADRFSLTAGLFGWVCALDLNYVGYAIVGLFAITWAIALAVGRVGRIEEKWTAGLRGAETTAD